MDQYLDQDFQDFQDFQDLDQDLQDFQDFQDLDQDLQDFQDFQDLRSCMIINFLLGVNRDFLKVYGRFIAY